MRARLAAYEGTGLEPEEIKDMMRKRKWHEALLVMDKDRAREIAKAEAEGRLVVLSYKE
jgi:hypothetical protein